MAVKFSIFYNENLPLVDASHLDESHGNFNSEEFLDPVLILHHDKIPKISPKVAKLKINSFIVSHLFELKMFWPSVIQLSLSSR